MTQLSQTTVTPQLRVTCYRVGIRMDEPQMAALLTSHGRPGFYFRVQEEDEVGVSDTLCEVSSSPNSTEPGARRQ